MNRQRITVCHEGSYFRNGLFVLPDALEPAKDYVTVLSPAGEAGRSIGLASHMERDDEDGLSFIITLEPYLNHDNFEWFVYLTSVEFDSNVVSDGALPFYRVVGKATIQAVMAHHIRYTPRSSDD